MPQATLPIAILERPSLEDSAVTPKQVTLQVEECDPPEDDANRSTRAKTNFRPQKNENLTRSAARLRLGITNNGSNSSSMVSFKNRTKEF